MNPNFDQGADTEPDTQDPNEAGEGENEMTFSTGDYPELEGLQAGAPVKVTCQATVKDAGDGNVTLSIDPGACEFETEGQADKSMKQMSEQNSYPDNTAPSNGSDF